MKTIKKMCAISLIFSILLSTYAMAESDVNNDPYALGTTETLYIYGVNTTFYHYYTSDGDRAIDISYENSLDIDTVIYGSSNTVYLNDNAIGHVSLVDGLLRGGANTDWELFTGPVSTYISWAIGTTAAVVAAGIAAAVGLLSGNIVAAVGTSALSALAAACIGATITTSIYERRVNWVPMYKYEFTLEASTGDTYGPYSHSAKV